MNGVRGGSGRSGGHWKAQTEVSGANVWFTVMPFMARHFPLVLMRLCAVPVSFCYYCAAKNARRHSRRFLDRARKTARRRGRLPAYVHFLSFALSLVDKTAAWSGRITLDSVRFRGGGVDALIERLERGEGALLVCSHIGNAEMLRALALFGRTRVARPFTITSILDVAVNARFTAMLRALNPSALTDVISADAIDAGTIGALQETVARGGLVVIAGDRASAHTARFATLPFLGKPARWSLGPFYLAALLAAPAYFAFGLRAKTLALRPVYDMHVIKSAVGFDCGRAERKRRVLPLLREYVRTLETYCAAYPFQWYNFYDFWEEDAPERGGPEYIPDNDIQKDDI